MGTLEACPPVPQMRMGGFEQPLIVVGVTDSQTCLVLRGRLKALRDAGFHVVLISAPGDWATKIAADDGVDHLGIPMKRGFSPMADLVSLFRLWRALRRLRPELAEFSTPKAGLLGNIAGFLCRIPVRIYLLRGLRLETATGLQRRLLEVSERIAAACSHLVVCNSESLRFEALALGIAPEHKLRVIGDGSSGGVDTGRFALKMECKSSEVCASLGIANDAPVIGFVGRLTRDKGIPELLQAFNVVLEKSPGAVLLLVGWFDESEDALSPLQRAWIGSHPQILCTGFVPETPAYYQAMDLLVLPTWREGLPNVILEAAASGLPVVSTRVTGARDAVLHHRTGLLVPAGDGRALAQAIEQLMLDPALRRQMGMAGRTWVAERFSHARVQSLTVGLYRQLIVDAGREEATAAATGAVTVD